MKHLFACLLLALFSTACSHPSTTVAKEEDAEIMRLNRADVETRLEDTVRELAQLDEQARSARSRRDNAQLKLGDDATKQAAYDGAEAELEAIRVKQGALLHRQHALEGRLRELAD